MSIEKIPSAAPASSGVPPSPGRPPATLELSSLDFGSLAKSIQLPFFRALLFWMAFSLGGALFLAVVQPGYALSFLAITATTGVMLFIWLKSSRKGLPFLPLLAVQGGIVYAIPLLTRNEVITEFPSELLLPCAGLFAMHGIALAIGWSLARGMGSRPARFRFALPPGERNRQKVLGTIAFAFLGLAILGNLVIFTGLLRSFSTVIATGLLPIIRTFSDAAMYGGALLGGFTQSRGPSRLLYWISIGGLCVIKFSGILLSDAIGLCGAVAIGILLGSRKMPWTFLIVMTAITGFLNQSKFVMRERYWVGQSFGGPSSLSEMPAFFSEWAAASIASFTANADADQDSSTQTLFSRINNLQNLLFVAEAMTSLQIPSLHGAGYATIPPLLIPRIFWPNKPRSHEGQVLLNVHFERQPDVESTEITYIAWGLLPEAIGNLGLFWGPLLIGLALGFLVGWAEVWSIKKIVLSIEGLIALSLFLLLAISFEMVAGVLITSILQLLVAVVTGALLIRQYLGKNGRLR